MRAVRTVAEIRALEAQAMQCVSEAKLIERASFAVATTTSRLMGGTYGRRVLVLAGAGHNGADAVWAGVHLARRGAGVTAALTSSRPGDEHLVDAVTTLLRLGGRVDTLAGLTPLAPVDAVIDGVAGIGYQPRADDDLTAVAALAAGAGGSRRAVVVAVDVPSGVAADTGTVAGTAVRADATVTFIALKRGLLLLDGSAYAGLVQVADIGVDPGQVRAGDVAVLTAADVASMLPAYSDGDDKYRRGVVGVIAGSAAYPGAAVLACGGALRTGAGLVRLYAPGPVADAVRNRWPEVVAQERPADPAAERVDAWVVGPGMGTDSAAADLVAAVLADRRPVLLDADGITVAARDPGRLARAAPTIVTPHAAEFRRLAGAVAGDPLDDPLGAARRAAAALQVTVLLKGATTVVADADGTARLNPTGTPWLATAGSGDVLSGACGALLAGGCPPLAAGSAGAWLHGLAALLAAGGPAPLARAGAAAPGAPVVAGDVADRLPEALRVARWPEAAPA